MAKLKLSHERMRSDATAATQRDGNIRERVRDLTLRALRNRPFEPGEMKAVLHAMTEGITLGAAKRSGDVRAALSQAFSGLDEAVGRAAAGSQLMLRELATRTRNDHEARRVLDNLRRLEKDFLSTVEKAAGSAQSEVKRELRGIVTHAQRTGTDTGRKVAATLSDFSTAMGSIAAGSTRAGIRATRDVGARFADLASGMLAGMADAVRPGTPGGTPRAAGRRSATRRRVAHK